MDTIFSYTIALLFSSLLFIKLLLSLLSNKSKQKRINPPPSGPPQLPIIGHLYLFKKPMHRTLDRLSARYGPILLLRFGSRPVLVVSSAPLAEECFSKNDVTFANRPQLHSERHLSYNYTNLGDTNYGAHWRNLRRTATVGLLSSHRLHAFSGMREDEVRAMIAKLFREASAGGVTEFKRVGLRPWLYVVTLNVMMRMITGKRYFEDSEKAREFEEIVEESQTLSGASNLGDFMPLLRLVDFEGVEKRLVRLQEWRDRFLQSLIDEHRKEVESKINGEGEEKEEKKKTMLGAMISLQESDPEYYTDRIIKSLMATSLVAGTDTSSKTMEWAMTLLLNHPETLNKAIDEIDAKVGTTRLLEESDLQNLLYLQAIVQETLRMHPAAPLLLPHESSGTCTVGGFDIPDGTMLLVNSYTIQRDPSLWEEPDKFKPERFLDGAKAGERSRLMIPFGMGRRRCPGESLALHEMGLALGTILQCFEWRRVGEEEVDMEEDSGVTAPKVKPLEAMFRPRAAMLDVLFQL